MSAIMQLKLFAAVATEQGFGAAMSVPTGLSSIGLAAESSTTMLLKMADARRTLSLPLLIDE
jgi:hypothetical protein